MGVLKIFRIKIVGRNADIDDIVLADLVWADAEVLLGDPHDNSRSRWVVPERLLREVLEVGQLFQVGQIERAPLKIRLDLLLEAFLDLRVLRERVDHHAGEVPRRVRPREIEREELVDDLLDRKCFGVVYVFLNENLEEVSRVLLPGTIFSQLLDSLADVVNDHLS